MVSKKSKFVSSETLPSGLVISSILLAVHAVIGQVMSLWFLSFPMPMFSAMQRTGDSVGLLGAYVLMFAIIGFAIAVLEVFTAYSLYHQKPWSKLAASVFAVLMLIQLPFFTLFGLIILYFLWFDEQTKKLFPN